MLIYPQTSHGAKSKTFEFSVSSLALAFAFLLVLAANICPPNVIASVRPGKAKSDDQSSLFESVNALKENNYFPFQESFLAPSMSILAPDDYADNLFGSSVAISGNTAIVGARRVDILGNINQGAAYIFVKNGNGWSFHQRIYAFDGAAGDSFGGNVAIDGDTAVVTAINSTIGSNSQQGSAYVFVRNQNSWEFKDKLKATDGSAGDWFGSGAAISGDTIVVGAYGKDLPSAAGAGGAYVFKRSGTTWSQEAILSDTTPVPAEQFGISVAIEGNTCVVGAYQDNYGQQQYRGSAFVFTRSGTIWIEQANFSGADSQTEDRFGITVGISGETIAVGAYLDDFETNSDKGSAYFFTRTGGIWTQQQKISAGDGMPSDRFGSSVVISGDVALIGSPLDDVDGNIDQGSFYLFRRINGVWTQRSKVAENDGVADGQFGGAQTLSGKTAIVCAANRTVGANPYQGRCSAYSDITRAGFTPFDFDADGKADIAVFRPSTGVWYLQGSLASYNAVAHGTANDLITPADFDGDEKTDPSIFTPASGTWKIISSATGSTSTVQFGQSGDLPRPGDFDGDGKSDIAVYRPNGGVWYWIGSLNSQFNAVQFGSAGDSPVMGDFDGDGKADFAVYRPGSGTGSSVWYYIRSSNGQLNIIGFGLNGDLPVAADYDGDAKTDVAVFRPATGAWYRINSSNAQQLGNMYGQAGDRPAPADYDSDGKTDLAIFRPSNGYWYVQRSQLGEHITPFGLSGDVPISSAFIP